MASETTELERKTEKPDLDKLYRPLGIQALNAANCCKQKEMERRGLYEGYPQPTD